jgi:hypothetical protein
MFDNLLKIASEALGSNQQQTAQAASDHVAGMDPNDLASHLQQSLGSMDGSSLAGLGQQLLKAFDSHPASPASGGDAAAAAGTDSQAVASGSPDAISSLIAYAQSNPQILQAASSAFMQHNPQALTQLAPGLLQGILGKLGH